MGVGEDGARGGVELRGGYLRARRSGGSRGGAWHCICDFRWHANRFLFFPRGIRSSLSKRE